MSAKKVTIEEIKAIAEPIARKYGVERVYLFGSYPRGDVTENSDVDLRVDKGSLKGMFALCGLYTAIEEKSSDDPRIREIYWSRQKAILDEKAAIREAEHNNPIY